MYHRSLGQYNKGIECYLDALRIANETGDITAEGLHVSNLGSAYQDVGRLVDAIDCLQLGLQISREFGAKSRESVRIQ